MVDVDVWFPVLEVFEPGIDFEDYFHLSFISLISFISLPVNIKDWNSMPYLEDTSNFLASPNETLVFVCVLVF